MVPMDGVHEDHMDMDVQVFMDERARLARGSHGCACTRFPWMAYTRITWMWMYRFFMDECARLARGSHGWHTRESHGHGCTGFSWMSVQG